MPAPCYAATCHAMPGMAAIAGAGTCMVAGTGKARCSHRQAWHVSPVLSLSKVHKVLCLPSSVS